MLHFVSLIRAGGAGKCGKLVEVFRGCGIMTGMGINELLSDKTKKPTEKRREIAKAVADKTLAVSDFAAAKIEDKNLALILEALEELSRQNPEVADLSWLKFAESHLLSPDNNVKREAARIIGNTAHLFPDNLETAVPKLIENTNNTGTVVRWSCAYALGKIIAVPKYAQSDLYDKLTALAGKEQMNGNKNQYLNGLKKADKLRS